MRNRIATTTAALAVLGLMLWFSWSVRRASVERMVSAEGSARIGAEVALADEAPLEGSEAVGSGSAVPCAVPLAWRVARVDPDFGVTPQQVETAVRRAAALWEAAVGRPLFRDDPEGGFPVRLVFDARQERTQERVRLQDAYAAVGRELETWRTDLNARTDRYLARSDAHELRRAELERRVAEHNARVERFKNPRDVPDSVLAAVSGAGDRLELERFDLGEALEALRALRDALGEEEGRFNEAVDAHVREGDRLARAFPPVSVESGLYREAVRDTAGRAASVSREIRIYRFDDLDDLVLVAAHELGHALGVGHAAGAGALMSATFGVAGPGAGVAGVQPPDVALLRGVCPDL